MRLLLFTILFVAISVRLLAQEAGAYLCSHHKSAVLNAQMGERLNFSQGLYDLMEQYDIKQYHINLTIETNTVAISGNVKFAAKARTNISTFAFELHPNYAITSVVVKGVTYSGAGISRSNNEIRVSLSTAINENENFEAIIFYNGNGPVDNNNIDAGFCQRTAPNGKKYTYSMSQPYGSADWMPVKQILADKADSVKVYITTSSSNKVGSQGVLKNVVNVGGGKLRYEWESKYPIAYYLISFAVGEYAEHIVTANIAGTPVPIQSYLYDAASITANQTALEQGKLTLERFSLSFGDYPFKNEKYGHCQVPHDFYLENQTMSSMINFPNTIVAHEMAHQWFGDALSLKSFSEIGLSEGFANYSEILYREYFIGLSAAQTTYRSWINSIISQPGGSVYLVDSLDTQAMFNSRLIYQKGGSLIHMIRYLINDDARFYQTLAAYTNTFKHQAVSYNDFASVVNSVGGVNLSPDFLPQWYRGEGYPTYNITWNWKDGFLHIISNQVASKPSVTPFFKMPFELALTDNSGNTTIMRLAQNTSNQNHRIPMATPITSVTFDPRVYLVAKNTLVRNNNLVIDNAAPLITALNPSNQSVANTLSQNLEITFDEAISKNTGKITVRNDDDSIFEELQMSSAKVSANNKILVINLEKNLEIDKNYYVEVSNEIVKDISGNVFTGGFTGRSTWAFSTLNTPLALENNFMPTMYPNPVSKTLFIDTNQSIEHIKISNSLGQIILQKAQSNSISLEKIPSGVYYVHITLTNGQKSTQKVVKQ